MCGIYSACSWLALTKTVNDGSALRPVHSLSLQSVTHKLTRGTTLSNWRAITMRKIGTRTLPSRASACSLNRQHTNRHVSVHRLVSASAAQKKIRRFYVWKLPFIVFKLRLQPDLAPHLAKHIHDSSFRPSSDHKTIYIPLGIQGIIILVQDHNFEHFNDIISRARPTELARLQ